ncbi:hypothetical protein B0T11DRAFT_296594 [Plectosphaerella cucumerina]|uniref:Uncharacterized protein n=1 Tax=Plectosphaerella cucumerina TaxID=40658 RepID=A0A8K0X8I2_9PEZI|nr:hypothetical protein B0T11DRAFT_296594 [Plectosphaerella cucumerina]
MEATDIALASFTNTRRYSDRNPETEMFPHTTGEHRQPNILGLERPERNIPLARASRRLNVAVAQESHHASHPYTETKHPKLPPCGLLLDIKCRGAAALAGPPLMSSTGKRHDANSSGTIGVPSLGTRHAVRVPQCARGVKLCLLRPPRWLAVHMCARAAASQRFNFGPLSGPGRPGGTLLLTGLLLTGLLLTGLLLTGSPQVVRSPTWPLFSAPVSPTEAPRRS